MAILDDTKIALRITTNDAGIDADVTRLINAAVLDLTKTADIAEIDAENCDDFVKTAIITYVKSKWPTYAAQSKDLIASYDLMKASMIMSEAYGTYDNRGGC